MKKTPLLDKSEKRLHFPEANVFKKQKRKSRKSGTILRRVRKKMQVSL